VVSAADDSDLYGVIGGYHDLSGILDEWCGAADDVEHAAGHPEQVPSRRYRLSMESQVIAALVFSITLWILGVVVGALVLYAIIRTSISHGMRSFKRWERSGQP
jgi:hypothetical protein